MVSEAAVSVDLQDGAPRLGKSCPCGVEGWEALGCRGCFQQEM